jgi:hypothetical protein
MLLKGQGIRWFPEQLGGSLSRWPQMDSRTTGLVYKTLANGTSECLVSHGQEETLSTPRECGDRDARTDSLYVCSESLSRVRLYGGGVNHELSIQIRDWTLEAGMVTS